uniref:hypothetical protein n=1 Tax=Alistipes sp. TaxID=1872444 RepID=UPI0040571BB1
MLEILEQASVAELDGLLERYPWATPLRVRRMQLLGEQDPTLTLMESDRLFPRGRVSVDREAILSLTSEDRINRFLKEKELRIVAEEGEVEEEITTEAMLDEEDDLVSEELAEVYLGQGLRREALEIYRRLSLLNPEKSVYFAEIIQRIETNN